MTQQTLFDVGPRRMKRTRTQNDAWKEIADKLPRTRARVYRFIAKKGAWGATRKEIAAGLGISYETLNEKCKDYPDFSEAIRIGQGQAIQAVENARFRLALQGSVRPHYQQELGQVIHITQAQTGATTPSRTVGPSRVF